ncbi:hypothetical protein QJS04_geneDACA021525 [Acorus gramineus]|uniref:Uncharacterized protein n=1 Tax=Acorus gramineus TaxID=55184 RepID=A0AAV9A073_ACOGR|nr:hypothetical protein QJS04_geneDACA021525 [Acorus gramineus]
MDEEEADQWYDNGQPDEIGRPGFVEKAKRKVRGTGWKARKDEQRFDWERFGYEEGGGGGANEVGEGADVGEEGGGGGGFKEKPKLVAPITPSEIATEFAHYEPSVARINNGSFGSCPSLILSAPDTQSRTFINANDVEEVSIVDNATAAAAINLKSAQREEGERRK